MSREAIYRFAVLACAIAAVWVWTRPLAAGPKPLRVTILDVGQGDSTVIEAPNGAVMVVDAGRSFEDGDTGRQVVLPYLRSRGINRIHALALTHADDDHIGGAKTLLARIRVDRLLLPLGESADPPFMTALDLAAEQRVPALELGAGQSIALGPDVIADVLNPTPESGPQEKDNDRSLVFRIRRGVTSILLSGDIEESAESRLSRLAFTADVLKAAHHGSKTSTSDRFLDRVRPQLAIVSAGKNNSFGHPHPTVVQRLESRRIPLLRTDQHGAITLESDGHHLQITTTR